MYNVVNMFPIVSVRGVDALSSCQSTCRRRYGISVDHRSSTCVAVACKDPTNLEGNESSMERSTALTRHTNDVL